MGFEIYRFANIINLFLDADGIASYFCGATKLRFIWAES
jgi:hypothetical protein